ncbi:hypothetical protein K1T71_005402 [Dendrolimus kikuchii]|uniref:Uncharacterized protein n=1 Tax=Dendrolimus kikuchii TaxID=765133 RepID=A0ACC1D5E1_9NEOP|nr:hypothetical protein K1T71_005402 [Dendrolimus kikuchii]
MIANLPLLFANGNPTALSKIKLSELEKFITFMVTCSWGHDTAIDIRRPPWWPHDVPFSHPFVRPSFLPNDWEARLKNLVKKCYNYHKSPFLLVFSAQLARYPRNRLMYVDNLDHTTSLYYKPSGRLLVTFRNENKYYDRLAPPYTKVLQPKATDIYLCDNCDSHFDNLEILQAHERLCNNEIVPVNTCSGGLNDLLSALKLQPIEDKSDSTSTVNSENGSRPKNLRSAASIDRGPPYPFSSLAYTRNIKSNVQRDTNFSRERIERYCCTSNLNSKILVSKGKNQQFPIRYRRPIDYWHRKQVFPNQRKKNILDINGQLLLLKCRPITVDVEQMTLMDIEEYFKKLKEEAEIKQHQQIQCPLAEKDIEFVEDLDCDQPLDIEDPLKRDECEVIDLCSDDESPSVNENDDPRAGVTCVMRGGAVLRRTAATPQALPAEPCGARQCAMAPAVLQPHPVILIAHTLNNLQTISID